MTKDELLALIAALENRVAALENIERARATDPPAAPESDQK